ncbi:MAG: PilZ domain-containing protein [Steroidobacteraceae bacterium]
MYEGLDTIVLFEELAYEDLVPLAWHASNTPITDLARRSFVERNVKLLQACTALEEHGQPEKLDERTPYHADIVRLDMKVNLLLDLVGQILTASHPRPEAVPVRFNALGAAWQHKGAMPVANTPGVLELYLRECVVEPLRLSGQIASVGADGRVKVKFDNCGETVADLIEKLAFRRHRRQVAGARSTQRDA